MVNSIMNLLPQKRKKRVPEVAMNVNKKVREGCDLL